MKSWRRVLRTIYKIIFAFAQLRAEVAENAAGEARRRPEITKNQEFGDI